MRRNRLLSFIVVLGCLPAAPLLAQQHHTAGTMNDDALIKSAEAAAPPAISKEAAIVAVSSDGKMRTLRKGSNNFTCMPDNPATPGPDPMCMDENALEWATAWIEHKEPSKAKVGFRVPEAGSVDSDNPILLCELINETADQKVLGHRPVAVQQDHRPPFPRAM